MSEIDYTVYSDERTREDRITELKNKIEKASSECKGIKVMRSKSIHFNFIILPSLVYSWRF